MNSELDVFLKEGIKKYSTAKDVISRFEQKMGDELGTVLRGCASHLDLAVIPKKENFLAKPGGNGDRYGYWLCSRFAVKLGSVKTEVLLEAGVWWAIRDVPVPVVFYAGVKDGPAGIKNFVPKIKNKNIFHYDRWLCLDASKDTDLERDYRELLSELLSHLA